MKTTLKSKVSRVEGYSYGEPTPGTTFRITTTTPRAKTEYPWPEDYPHSHSTSDVPLVDPRTTSRSTEMSSPLRGLS
jgi:hypothetical protein